MKDLTTLVILTVIGMALHAPPAEGQIAFAHAVNNAPHQPGAPTANLYTITGDHLDIVGISPSAASAPQEGASVFVISAITCTALHNTTDGNGNPQTIPVPVPTRVFIPGAFVGVDDYAPPSLGNQTPNRVTFVTTVSWERYVHPSTVPAERGTSTDTWSVNVW